MRANPALLACPCPCETPSICRHYTLVCSLTGVSPEVNELLMEAQLLQVSLPEIQELYQTLLAKPAPAPQTDRSSPARPSSEKVSVHQAAGEDSLAWGA